MLSGLSFRCLKELLHGSSKYRCLIKAVRGTWNFVWQQATLVQGCTSEAQMNMDVNLCRLPELFLYFMKFLETLNNAVTYGEQHECRKLI